MSCAETSLASAVGFRMPLAPLPCSTVDCKAGALTWNLYTCTG